MPIARKILAHYNRAAGEVIRLTDEACRLLIAHSWPGNVRELDNVMQRALILQQGSEIRGDDIMIEAQVGMVPEVGDDGGHLQSDLRDRETEVILETLQALKGSRKKTAEKLGISPRTLRYKLAKMREAGIEFPD